MVWREAVEADLRAARAMNPADGADAAALEVTAETSDPADSAGTAALADEVADPPVVEAGARIAASAASGT